MTDENHRPTITDRQAEIIGQQIGLAIAAALTDRAPLSLSSRFIESIDTGFQRMARAIASTRRP